MDMHAETLRLHGIKPSLTRMMILEYLTEQPTHPTVEEIYQALIHQLPTLSKTTVYNTLHLFTQQRLAREVMLKDQESRYDLARHPHAHFQCLRCDTVYDTHDMPSWQLPHEFEQHQIDDVSVLFTGLCARCKSAGQGA
jgi:Fe2+ or Zn2+ uptake regulation protein